jgi:amino acid permease
VLSGGALWLRWAGRAFPAQWSDCLLVFPIFILSFMCTFNMLPVHASLVDPTRDRIKTVIHSSMAGTFLVYTATSLGEAPVRA